ncbi:MAG: site-2 protease family protein [Planctomycetota bacterium]|nr:site-2 protease family protein [Planctomycetota bacterium]
MNTLASEIIYFWSQWLGPILMFAIGLGMVVFIHELGHFLAARCVGIKVERFALGFGPRLFGFKWGQTDYCVSLIPLGGYIKMLGQEDFAPLKEDEKPDPRSFMAKSVGARFFVIAAGVVMNVIFAAGLFITVGLTGKDFPAAVVGGTSPSYPASQAKITWADGTEAAETGFKPGDRILAMEGDSVLLALSGGHISHFDEIAMVAALADPDEQYTFTIERDVAGLKRTGKTKIGVKKSTDGKRYVFGIGQASDLAFGKARGLTIDSPFRKGDRIVAIDGQDIKHYWQVGELENSLTGKPVTVAIRRDGQEKTVEIRPALFRKDDAELLSILGMAPRVRVVAVVAGSSADKAGLKPGDIIVGYGDRGAPSHQQLLGINEAVAGEGTNIIVQRGGETKSFWIVPKQRANGARIGIVVTPDIMNPVVAKVVKGSTAEKLGIVPGARITAVNGRAVESWTGVYNAMKDSDGGKLAVTYRLGAQTKTAEPAKLDESEFSAGDYRFFIFSGDMPFKPLMIRIQKKNPLAALAWGGRETLRIILSTYISLRSLVLGNVSTEEMRGLVGIGSLAIEVGRERPLIDFVYFMAFISTALAVFNFLPIPVMDGGHAVFLLIEKIRGKPVSVKIMNIVQFIGLALLGLIFVLVTWQDIARWLDSLW